MMKLKWKYAFLAGLILACSMASSLNSPAQATLTNPSVVMETSKGTMVIDLNREKAPLTVANFLYYVASGFYDGSDGLGATIFHRVVNGFVIQGGGYTEQFYTSQSSSWKTTLAYAIFNEADNGLSNTKYTIAMARTSEPHSATSQFFINVADNLFLDHKDNTKEGYGYAVFGSLRSGQDVADAIAVVDTMQDPGYGDAPVDPIVIQKAYIEGMEDLSTQTQKLYYPHVASKDGWETEICVINTSSDQSLKGTLWAYNNYGDAVSGVIAVDLAPNGRAQLTVSKAFPNADQIGYMVLKTDSNAASGYIKFYSEGWYRVAVPAVKSINSGDIYLPHIAADALWWTGIALVNTTDSEKDLLIEFNTGDKKQVILPKNSHAAFTIDTLFNGEVPEGVASAVITSGDGIIGLELFGSKETSGGRYLSGILITGNRDSKLYFPHLAGDTDWWTGIVAYNTAATSCELIVKPYTENGIALATQTISIDGHEKYIGTAGDLQVPANTAWIKVQTSGDTPCEIAGFELFGTNNGYQLAGYSAVGIQTTAGIFPKLETQGWTGIAMVNTEFSRATVDLSAYDDAGTLVASSQITIESRSKVVDLPENLFSGASLAEATYIRFTSNKKLVAFQLNGSSDGTMLDGLPGTLP